MKGLKKIFKNTFEVDWNNIKKEETQCDYELLHRMKSYDEWVLFI